MSHKHNLPSLSQEPFFDDEGIFHVRSISSDTSEIVRLPPLSPRIITFLIRFKTSCYLDCCGLSALSFKPPVEWDKRWNFQSETMNAIQREIEKAQDTDAEVVQVHELRHNFYKDDWLMLLNHLAANMGKSKQWK